jgi:hypothetical protein
MKDLIAIKRVIGYFLMIHRSYSFGNVVFLGFQQDEEVEVLAEIEDLVLVGAVPGDGQGVVAALVWLLLLGWHWVEQNWTC